MESETITESNWTRWNNLECEPKFHQFWFEKLDVNFWYDFGDSYMRIIITVVLVIYLGSVWKLRQFMKDREPYKLRLPLFLWNVVIGSFSIMALYRLSSELLVMSRAPNGFYRSLCHREGLHMSTAYWAVLTAFSKPLFVLDTMFLILRKKSVDSMHIIHHTLAIIVGPVLIKISEPLVRWIGFANLLCHSIDYPLLALRSLKISVPKSRHIMAALEVGQMIFVLLLSAYTLFLKETGRYCLRHPKSIMITYAVYFGLLLVVVVTLLSPSYWKKGIKKIKISSQQKEAAKLD